MGMDDHERAALLERIDRLERSIARGEEGIASYARGFAKVRAELEEVRAALLGTVDTRPEPEPVPAPVVVVPAQAPPPPPAETPPAPPRVPPSRPAVPPRVAAPPRRTLGELARDWDLVGARGFAVAGGAVMALGIGFFFVLAANRGWIG